MPLSADILRLLNASPTPAVATANNVVLAANLPALLLLNAADSPDITGMDIRDVLPTYQDGIYDGLYSGPTTDTLRTVTDTKARPLDGAPLHIELTIVPVDKAPDAYVLFLRPLDESGDHVARIEHEHALQRAVFESIPIAAVILDAQRRVIRANARFTDLTGFAPEEVCTHVLWFEKLYPDPEYRAMVLAAWNKERYKPNTVREFAIACKDGGSKQIEFYGECLDDGRFLITMKDITERKAFEQELLDTRERLQATSDDLELRVEERTRELSELSKRMLTAQEEERRHVSRELHDSVAQNLNAIKLFLQEERRTLSERYPDFDPAMLQRLTDATQQAIDELRDIIHNMRPAVLDELGIRGALTDLLKRTRRYKPQLSFSLVTDLDEERLDSDTRLVLYRVAQECLHNILRHSGASQARISLTQNSDQAVLRVRDDGKGFSEADITPPAGLGIAGMRERLSLVGGHVSITPADGGGVSVEASVPLKRGA